MSSNNTKTYVFFLIILLFIGCDLAKKPTTFNAIHLIGSWLDNSKAKLHFTLFENGVAKSDNMETLKYKSWILRNDSLFIKVERIGNSTRFESIESYKIDTVDAYKLVLLNKNFKMSYTRKK
jgi:hypothetical protein